MANEFDLYIVTESVQDYLDKIGKMFKDPKITIVIRAPQLKDGDMIFTNDSLDKTIESIQKMKDRDAN